MTTRVFVTRRLPGSALDRLPDADVWPGDGPPSYDELVARVAGAEGLLCLLTDRIDRALLDAAPALRVVSQMAVGVDNIDVAACTERGIPVGHTPGVLTETTADLAWALILGAARRTGEAERYLRAGGWKTWSPGELLGRDVHGATLGIIGMGAIGKAVARRAAGFEMIVLHTSRSDPGVGLDELLRRSDVVTIHCPLTELTRGLIGERELALMRSTAILVNTSRGPVVDEDALAAALRNGTIAGAGLDVYRDEPLPPSSPLLELENVILLPHIGSASIETRARMASMAVDNLIAGLRGEPLPHCANPTAERRRS